MTTHVVERNTNEPLLTSANSGIELRDQPTVPNHHVTGRIGTGSTAQLWRASHLLLQQEVALKVLLPTPFDRYEERRTNFIHEALLARSMSNRSLIQVFDVGLTAEGLPFMSMALGHRTLQQATPLVECLDALRSTAIALDYLHANGVIHCDVKPSNVIKIGDGLERRWVLSDLGLAWRREWPISVGSGSHGFIAPERFARAQPTAASDIYSFGKLVWTVLTPHLDGSTTQRLDTLLRPAMMANPYDRPRSAVEVVQSAVLVVASESEHNLRQR